MINKKNFKYRNKLSFFFYFNTLFDGGILSLYILMVKYLHLKNSMLALILPPVVNVFYLIVFRTFISSITQILCYSADPNQANIFLVAYGRLKPWCIRLSLSKLQLKSKARQRLQMRQADAFLPRGGMRKRRCPIKKPQYNHALRLNINPLIIDLQIGRLHVKS